MLVVVCCSGGQVLKKHKWSPDIGTVAFLIGLCNADTIVDVPEIEQVKSSGSATSGSWKYDIKTKRNGG